MEVKKRYKYCFVPLCQSTTTKAPEKVFFTVPRKESDRRRWFAACRRDLLTVSKNTLFFCCADHFELSEDMVNYCEWKLMKGTRARLKPSVVPHIFSWQRKQPHLVERSAFRKRENMRLVQEAMSSYSKAILPATSSSSEKSSASSRISIISEEDGNDFQVKKELFNYFQMGHSVSSAKQKFTMHCKQKKTLNKHLTSIPTLRQTEIFYKEWQDVKDEEECIYVEDSLDNALKEGIFKKSEGGSITFKGFLDVVPKREIMYSVEQLESETNTSDAQIQDIKFPLVFISVGSVGSTPVCTAPLLYKLRHDTSSELVSDLVMPRIYSLCIDLEHSPEPVSNEILGIPTLANEPCALIEAESKYTLDIPIKIEPLFDGYEEMPTQVSNEMTKDTCILPTPIQEFPYINTSSEVDIPISICNRDTTEVEEINIKPNICMLGNSFFPLTFTLKGSVYETSNSRSLVYDLKQSSAGVQATEAVLSQISSIQINSLSEATFQLKDASLLIAEGPLNITIQTEPLKEDSNAIFSDDGASERVEGKDIPVIINASPSSDHFPVITDYEALKEQLETTDHEIVLKPGAYQRLKTEIKQEGINFNRGFFTIY